MSQFYLASSGGGTSNTPTGVDNLGIAYSSGTFTVLGRTGSDLSASNPAYITMPDASTPGLLKTYTITANQSFEDDAGLSDITGNLFGFTTSVAITVDVPFFLYACSDGTDVTFGISRVPNLAVAPVTADIGTPSTANADDQWGIFLFSDVTIANYAEKPVKALGSFRMRMSASDDWTVQTLDDLDGIGRWNDTRLFTVPPGQFGANSGTYTKDNGGTAPDFTTNYYGYFIKNDGQVEINLGLNLDDGPDGAGAVNAMFTIPFQGDGSGAFSNHQLPVRWKVGGGAYQTGMTAIQADTNDMLFTALSTGTWVTWAAFINGDKRFETYGTYTVAVS